MTAWCFILHQPAPSINHASAPASLIEGPLSQTNAYLAKVATSPQNALEHYQHILCLYLPDVYDKDNVTAVSYAVPEGRLVLDPSEISYFQVMRILLRNHGLSLSGVKSNLYTEIGRFYCFYPRTCSITNSCVPGVDSKHPSGIQSTVS